MEIIANTKEGFIIQASNEEVKCILQAVTGKNIKIEDITIGHKLPAIDYSSTITKVKSLNNNTKLYYLKEKVKDFSEEFKNLVEAIESASKIEV